LLKNEKVSFSTFYWSLEGILNAKVACFEESLIEGDEEMEIAFEKRI
jgi:hypothetical protein